MQRPSQLVRSLIKKRSATVVVLLAALTAIGYRTGKLLFVHVYADEPIKVRPYVLTYDNIVVHDGVEKVIGRTTESRRHDGAKHMSGVFYAAVPGQQDLIARRVDLPDGTTAMISDAVHAKSSARKPQADVARQNKADFFDRTGPDCISKEGARETMEGTDTLFGYSAVRFSQLTGKDRATQEAALSRFVSWRLPDFNCFEVQDFSQVRASKAEEWKTTQGNRLTGITATEPDPALFTNWLGYDEMKPSDVARRIAVAQGLTPQTCPRCFAPDSSDVNYKKWHENEK